MRYIILFIIVFSAIIIANAQEKKYVIDEKSGKTMLIGSCSKEDFTQDSLFNWWFYSEYGEYEPNDSVMNLIKLDSIKIVCVMGTWCSDSRREVPRFIKILDLLNYDLNNLEIFCVDRKKKAEGYDIGQFVIERVPTFILYKNNSEIGRIIETPEETLEKDLLKIILNN